MNEKHLARIAQELSIKTKQVRATADLLEDGATVPFIARYRKEATGSLDEVIVTAVRDRMGQLQELDRRRDAILKSLGERELLTAELEEKIIDAESLAVLEDIYLPYRPKRRTRATVAKEKGLEPLAQTLFEQTEQTDPREEAAAYVDPEKGVEKLEDALAGARDIIAEWVNEDPEARRKMRALYTRNGVFRTAVITGEETAGAKFRDYFDWQEPVATAPSHRVLAMFRGEKEGVLNLRITPPEEEALALLEALFIKGDGPAANEVKAAVHDAFKRLLSHSMETEVRAETKRRSDTEAIRVFANNLREVLLSPPLGQKKVMAIDPGIRTGCKVACLDRQGNLSETATIYPLRSEREKPGAAKTLMGLHETHQAEAVAVGNGTGGRETEAFLKDLDLPEAVPIVMVNESGASVYSASEAARAEFAHLDVSFRGAVSIGRRLMDPLAELVKIDPKSIGVGQYQHDVNQQALKESLDDVVMSCVNAVGVEVNTASEQLLTYVSGLGPQLAKNIVAYRHANGALSSRQDLKRVSRLGPKAFEQAAGFLRIRDGHNPLDASAVHPESYPVVAAIAADLDCELNDLIENDELRKKIDLHKYVSDNVGIPTLEDIFAELGKPGRDPREQFETFEFTEGVEKPGDLRPGMKLPGVVTNVTAFGAFVDIGVHQDGLVHKSQLREGFVKDPHKVVKVNQRVFVTVLAVDLERNRISLSMKEKPERRADADKRAPRRPDGNRKAKKTKPPERRPFNNPFATAFKK
jgi:uncharacterized protein